MALSKQTHHSLKQRGHDEASLIWDRSVLPGGGLENLVRSRQRRLDYATRVFQTFCLVNDPLVSPASQVQNRHVPRTGVGQP